MVLFSEPSVYVKKGSKHSEGIPSLNEFKQLEPAYQPNTLRITNKEKESLTNLCKKLIGNNENSFDFNVAELAPNELDKNFNKYKSRTAFKNLNTESINLSKRIIDNSISKYKPTVNYDFFH